MFPFDDAMMTSLVRRTDVLIRGQTIVLIVGKDRFIDKHILFQKQLLLELDVLPVELTFLDMSRAVKWYELCCSAVLDIGLK